MDFRVALSKGWALSGLMLASVVASLLGRTVADPMRKVARLAIAPLGDAGMYLATAPESGRDRGGGTYIPQDRARDLARENEILHRRLGELVRRLQGKNRQIEQIQAIRSRLYEPKADMPSELIPARVVGLDSLPYNATRIVHTGRSGRAGEGMLVTTRGLLTDRSRPMRTKLAVITASALVGRLTETDSFTARLQLVTDRGFAMAVLIRRDPRRRRKITDLRSASEQQLTAAHPDIEARARGDGARHMVIPTVKALHSIRPGDEVFTRPSDGFVGARIPVGKVVEVIDDRDQPGLFVTLRVAPHAPLAALREVYVVVPPHLPPAAEGEDKR